MVDVVIQQGVPHELIGEIPFWLDERDPRPARQQLHDNYRHGGGWHPFEGFILNLKDYTINYPGDPPQHPIAFMRLRKETIIMYHHAWVLILQPDDSFEICRMD